MDKKIWTKHVTREGDAKRMKFLKRTLCEKEIAWRTDVDGKDMLNRKLTYTEWTRLQWRLLSYIKLNCVSLCRAESIAK